MINEQFNTWMRSVADAARVHCLADGMYAGKDGAVRFARECGYAIPDFGGFGEKHMSATYSGICVIAYNLKPPIDAKEWLMALRDGCEYAKNLRKRE